LVHNNACTATLTQGLTNVFTTPILTEAAKQALTKIGINALSLSFSMGYSAIRSKIAKERLDNGNKEPFELHHIVPQTEPYALISRQILNIAGIGIHDPANLVPLSHKQHLKTQHQYAPAYCAYVNAQIEAACIAVVGKNILTVMLGDLANVLSYITEEKQEELKTAIRLTLAEIGVVLLAEDVILPW
jgi:hypothetical protein